MNQEYLDAIFGKMYIRILMRNKIKYEKLYTAIYQKKSKHDKAVGIGQDIG